MGEDTRHLGKGGVVKPAKPGWKLRYGCMIGLCLALLPIAVNLMVSFLAREEFYRELEQARRAGLPRSVAELAPPLVADADNAAPIYNAAFAQIVQPTPGDEKTFEAYQSWTWDPEKEAAALDALRAYVQKNRSALERLHEAAGKPECRFDLKYQDGFAMTMPHLAELRKASKLTRLEARLHLAEGREREAIRSIESLYAMSCATRGEPILISLLVGSAMEGLASETLRRALQSPLTDEKSLASLARALERARDDDRLQRALRGELYFGVNIMEKIRHEGWDSVASSLGMPRGLRWMYAVSGWALYKDMTFHLRTMTTAAELARQPYWQSRAAEAKLDTDVKRAPWWYMMSRMFLPAYASARLNWTTHQARVDGARIAVALARYRLARGSWPETLDRLVPDFLPALPMDPFTGQPYVYRFEGDSARVYSLGPLGFDNGGGTTGQDDQGTILWPLGDQTPFQGKR